jgi:hypothetical protein
MSEFKLERAELSLEAVLREFSHTDIHVAYCQAIAEREGFDTEQTLALMVRVLGHALKGAQRAYADHLVNCVQPFVVQND